MELNKTELMSILKMLQSDDRENGVVAFEALKQINPKNYLGELILLYKYGTYDCNEWENAYPKGYKALEKVFAHKFTSFESISSAECLHNMVKVKASRQSIELFLEIFSSSMEQNLVTVGYPAMTVTINLKENE